MTKLRFNITMSLDGYIAGPEQSLKNPLGIGGEKLHEWAVATQRFNEIHGTEGGATGPDNDILTEGFENIGATIMGRHMFGGGEGPWDGDSWRGWWGEEPPFHTPVFILTHHPRKPIAMKGGTTFYFITDGIHAALQRARDAASGKDVSLGGGADVAQQYMSAGLIDEMEIHVVPIFLGSGTRLFENTESKQTGYQSVRIVNSPTVSHYKYRRIPSPRTP